MVPEATSYRVLLSPPDPQGPHGAGTRQVEKKTRRAGRTQFVIIPLIGLGVTAAVAIHEAWESPEKPLTPHLLLQETRAKKQTAPANTGAACWLLLALFSPYRSCPDYESHRRPDIILVQSPEAAENVIS